MTLFKFDPNAPLPEEEPPLDSITSRLIVADDVEDRGVNSTRLRKTYAGLATLGVTLKVGTSQAFGRMPRLQESISWAHDAGLKTLLDCKICDNETAVEKAARDIAKLGVWACTFMALLKREAIQALQHDCGDVLPCGVSVFSTMESFDCWQAYGNSHIPAVVLRDAYKLEHLGVPLMVCAGWESNLIKARTALKTIVVGIRDAGASKDDQKRTCTIEEAVSLGGDYFVVGRPIMEAPDPVDAAKRCIERIERASEQIRA